MDSQFDLFRLSKAKAAVDLAPNTLRKYSQDGLNIYRCGKSAFVSRSELADHIRKRGLSRPPTIMAGGGR